MHMDQGQSLQATQVAVAMEIYGIDINYGITL